MAEPEAPAGAEAPPPTDPAPRHRLRRALAWGAAVALLLPLLLLALAWEAAPRVREGATVDPADVARAVALLKTHDPRRARPGVVAGAQVTERDIAVVLGHGLRRWVRLAAEAELQRGQAELRVSAPWPGLGGWLNVELSLRETAGLPLLHAVRVGDLPLPPWLARTAGEWALRRAGLGSELELAQDALRVVRFLPGQLLLSYAWPAGSAERLLAGLLPPEELQRLKAYSDRLVPLAAATDAARWQRPLAELVGPLFALAAERSAAGQDAAAENRAALAVLTLYALNRPVASVLPPARGWPRARPLQLLLHGRSDFPLHFLVSAALATEGTTPLSQAIGLYKELADARRGSGFSFNDMAANLSGTRFGERLVREPQAMQQRLARGVGDAELVPPVDDLPEFLPEAEFRARYGGVGQPAYEAVLADIRRRIDALPLLR